MIGSRLSGIFVLVLLSLAACGEAPPPGSAGSGSPATTPAQIATLPPTPVLAPPGPTPVPTAPAVPPAASPTAPSSRPTGGVSGQDTDESRAENAARAALAREKGVEAGDVRVISVSPREWPNAALGCPEPGMIYAEVITPGYLVVLEAGGERQEVHTDRAGRAVICSRQEATPAAGMGGDAMTRDEERAVEAARAVVSRQAGVPAGAIQVRYVTGEEWSDASLGCPEPGMMYAQVITPGYLVVLEAGGQGHEVHTDKNGRAVICAGGGQKPAP